MLWRPGIRELPLAPSCASVPASPLQLTAEQEARLSASCLSGDSAALTMESRRHWLVDAPEEPGRSDRSRPGSDTGGIRLDGLEQILLGDHTAGNHGPAKVGHFCTKPSRS